MAVSRRGLFGFAGGAVAATVVKVSPAPAVTPVKVVAPRDAGRVLHPDEVTRQALAILNSKLNIT